MDLSKIVKIGLGELVQAGRNARVGLQKRRVPVIEALSLRTDAGHPPREVLVAHPTREIIRKRRRSLAYFAIVHESHREGILVSGRSEVFPVPFSVLPSSYGPGMLGYWTPNGDYALRIPPRETPILLQFLVLIGEGREEEGS